LNPLSLKVLDGELAQFVGKQVYVLKVSSGLCRMLGSSSTTIGFNSALVKQIPKQILKAIADGAREIPLDPDKLRVFHYKKDDWQAWADPMTYAIMDDIHMLEKMKLADLSALDGAISQVRLWKLGDIEAGIFPTAAAIQRLSDILLSNPGGGAFDIIWGPELTVEDYNTNVHQFLGKAKYEPVWNAIYEGLGVPPTLTGASNHAGLTNNYISLKTLLQRLEYGRRALKEFWAEEIELVRQAMGFQRGAKIVFDNMVLADEAAEKRLLIELADRDIISIETLSKHFGELPEYEALKLRREERARKTGMMKPKTSPWHTPEKMFEFMKLALQRGYIAPEQTGMTEEFPEEFLDVESPYDVQMKIAEKAATMKTGPTTQQKKTNVNKTGRPSGKKDSKERKKRTPKPAGAATAAYLTTIMWARDAQKDISNIINPLILKQYDKKSLRALSSAETKEAERVKFAVMCQTEPFEVITKDSVKAILERGHACPAEYVQVYDSLYENMVAERQEEPSMDETRMIQIVAYASLNSDEERFEV
jgi:hypothetical protein